jgi:hypothetical protein
MLGVPFEGSSSTRLRRWACSRFVVQSLAIKFGYKVWFNLPWVLVVSSFWLLLSSIAAALDRFVAGFVGEKALALWGSGVERVGVVDIVVFELL